MGNEIILKAGVVPRVEQLQVLFEDAAWKNYEGKDLHTVQRAITRSMDVITAWDGAELVGLLRAVGDSYTILYVQDIVVKSAYRRQGIGKQMLLHLLSRYPTIQNRVILTNDTDSNAAFYHACGFVEATSVGARAYLQKE